MHSFAQKVRACLFRSLAPLGSVLLFTGPSEGAQSSTKNADEAPKAARQTEQLTGTAQQTKQLTAAQAAQPTDAAQNTESSTGAAQAEPTADGDQSGQESSQGGPEGQRREGDESIDQEGVEASGAASDASGSSSSVTEIQEITGPSDLRVILQPNPGAPEVSVCMSVDAGSRWDPPEAPGAYRMLAEVLLPGGYSNSRKNYEQLVKSRGGQSEVFVTRDLATFCTTAPASELPLALWVTGGRYTRFGLTQRARSEALERLAALSERLDGDIKDGRAPRRLRQMAFLGTPEYAHPELPNSNELSEIDLSLLRELHEESYVAARSVVTISGGFEPEVAQRLVTEHLSPVRPGDKAAPPEPDLIEQTTSRFSMAEDRSANRPAAWYGWVAPEGKEGLALEAALATVTSEDRLRARLVGPGKAARKLELSSESGSGPRLLRLRFTGTGSRSLGTIEKLLESEVRKLAKQGPKASELQETLQRLSQERADRLLTAQGRAKALSEGVLRGKAAEEILSPLSSEMPFDLSPEEVRLAAAHYLVPERRSAIEIYPQGWQDPWQKPMPRYHIVSSGETLTSIARQHGTSVAVITKMNGMSQSKPIYPGDKLKVPRGRTKKKKLRKHTVRRGDTLSGLAVKYGVSARAIAEMNGMSLKQPIRTGQELTIPSSKKSSSGSSSKKSSGPKTHRVRSGETLGGIALKHGVKLSALARANGLTTKSMVRIGQKLVIPQGSSARRPGRPATITYEVKSGDTLSEIAKRHGVTVTSIERANGFNRKWTLRAGQKIKIPKK